MTKLDLAGTQSHPFLQSDSQTIKEAKLVEEVPLAISINGITHAVMMVTPVELEAFALGFAHSESIIDSITDVRDLNLEPAPTNHPDISSYNMDITISPRRFAEFKSTRQARLGATGCGICGVESLEVALPSLHPLPASKPLPTEILQGLRERLFAQQTLGQESGAIHAALLISPEGESLVCMEDIGRHNALDKVIGYALQHKLNLENHSVVMSSRCSTELVQKAVRAGLSALIHLASPSTLAVKLAEQYRLTLIHLPRKDAPRLFVSDALNKAD